MKNRHLILLLLLVSSLSLPAQQVKIINAEILEQFSCPTDKNTAEWQKYHELSVKENITEKEQEFIENFRVKFPDVDETDNIWNIHGYGCSWYCGGRYRLSTSSELASNGKNLYTAEMLSDDDTRTAWVEGAKGYGIGESITIKINYNAPRITAVYIVNGYAKNDLTWKNNSRVKSFNMYDGDKLIATVNLKDSPCTQTFQLPYPFPDRPEEYYLVTEQDTTLMELKLMITDIYKGDKYDDTAISEIMFDGLDVHCLAKGTKIVMKHGTIKKIENIKIGDEVQALVFTTSVDAVDYPESVVTAIHKAKHKEMLRLTLENGMQITTTADHPFFTQKGFASYNPEKTKQCQRYKEESIAKYEEGTEFYVHSEKSSKLKSIEVLKGEYETYTLELNHARLWYIANGFLVGQE